MSSSSKSMPECHRINSGGAVFRAQLPAYNNYSCTVYAKGHTSNDVKEDALPFV